MVKRQIIDKKLQNKIFGFDRLLRRSGINPEQIIVYGSYAKGSAKDYSDVDICVVSPRFDKNPEYYFQKIWHLAGQLDSSLEPIPFTPQELNNKYSTLATEIKKYGVRVI